MEDKTYDCLTCPYPRHKTPELIFCDVCIRKIMDEHHAKKNREKKSNEAPDKKNTSERCSYRSAKGLCIVDAGAFCHTHRKDVAT